MGTTTPLLPTTPTTTTCTTCSARCLTAPLTGWTTTGALTTATRWAACLTSRTCSSALFRHEIAFVLGQVASPLASEQLLTRLRDENENPMVRHECAEALGDIPGVEIEAEMAKYLDPKVDPVVRESCVIALDMADYNNSKEFQYANGLSSINIPA